MNLSNFLLIIFYSIGIGNIILMNEKLSRKNEATIQRCMCNEQEFLTAIAQSAGAVDTPTAPLQRGNTPTRW